MTSTPRLLLVLLGLLVAGCGKRPTQEKKTELRDHGTACLRVVGGVFQGPGMRTVEATVTAADRKPCTGYDIATCTIEQGEHGEIIIASTLALFAPYGQCATDAGAIGASCRAIVAQGDHDIVFGRARERRTVSEQSPPICLGE